MGVKGLVASEPDQRAWCPGPVSVPASPTCEDFFFFYPLTILTIHRPALGFLPQKVSAELRYLAAGKVSGISTIASRVG